MSTTTNLHSRGAISRVLRLLVSFALLASVVYGHAQQNQPQKLAYGADMANVPDAIAKVKSGDFAAIHVDLIARAGAVEAIPILKEQFVHVQDPLLKAKIASALVRMGDKDDSYWDFLVEFVTPALESDAPDFMSYDSHGKSMPGPSREFEAWLRTHNLSPDSAGEDSVYMLPGKVAFLGWSRDPRAIPLLRQALSSPNHMIEVAAAKGLAEIGDKDSIPFIVDACRKAPAEAAAAIAESLVYFDEPEAQSAVDEFVPTDTAKIYRDAKAHGKKRPWSN